MSRTYLKLIANRLSELLVILHDNLEQSSSEHVFAVEARSLQPLLHPLSESKWLWTMVADPIPVLEHSNHSLSNESLEKLEISADEVTN